MASDRGDVEMPDGDAATDDGQEHHDQNYIDEDLDEKYPNRPHNHSVTFPFHDLYLTLFNPLNENKKKPTGPVQWRRKAGPHGAKNVTPNEARRNIVDRFISRWRSEVGNDIYPAFRLIVPEKDRDRPMYGLKEKTIGKLLVRVMKIDKNSEDGYNLLNWKLPGVKATSAMAGDFAGRCYEVVQKRPMRTKPGNLTIAEVNEMLDQMSAAQKEENQLPIFEQFYNQMNAEEMMWLIRIVLRQMKVGATEKTLFHIWHQDAENLFNVSSSLRRVCWELWDHKVRLDKDDKGIMIMQCFQPQLAAFQMHSMERMVARMNLTEDDPVFWIEEKLDGERMQLHMQEDKSVPGGRRFAFWSRKAKDYTYLYGNGFEDENAALTRHIREAFDENVRNIILDGEMITWDPETDAMVGFGTLKTAALSEQRNPFSTGHRPLYRVFDCLYLNDTVLTNYTLRDRRRALESSVKNVYRRLEVHGFEEGRTPADIEPKLRKVVAESSEGLVIKNPRSMYRLNDRNDDWMKVKPEYMTEFGEALDCIVIGGYYGSGRRGGRLSSFLCGLRVDAQHIARGFNEMCCYSFFKVGGGLTAGDYAEVRHRTDGKWHDWDSKKPPTEYVLLGGGDKQYEKPDVWIKPDESIVFEVKAASVTTTDQFAMNVTLRFPRFKKMRTDKDWKSALSIQDFIDLKMRAEGEKAEKQFKVDDARRQKRQPKKARKKEVVLAGNEEVAAFAGPQTKLFEGLTFFIVSESLQPKKSKVEIEQLVKAHGGHVVQTEKDKATIIVADRNLVRVASIKKAGERNLVRPAWLFDCIQQAEIDVGRPTFLLKYEPNHLFFTIKADEDILQANIDAYGDSYARDITTSQLRSLLEGMAKQEIDDNDDIMTDMLDDNDMMKLHGWMFRGLTVYVVDREEHTVNDIHGLAEGNRDRADAAKRMLDFGGASMAKSINNGSITHVIFASSSAKLRDLRESLAERSVLPRLVTLQWVEECWKERTLLDEERYVPK